MNSSLTFHRLSVAVLAAGTLLFAVPYLQLPGLVLLLIGSARLVASNRRWHQKAAWLLPLALAMSWVVHLYFFP